MVVFSKCQKINNHLLAGEPHLARNELIKLLDHHEKNKISYSPLVNHLIRETGLYPYIKTETAAWQDKFAYEAFRVSVGKETETLHREQSFLLKQLVEGESIAVSAPTSFGKSFIIDAFIALKKPRNVVIIVPTIALTDETRRRIYKKFSDEYKIITTTDVELADKNIFIFPQERALGYADKIETIDLLIVDEFYKASITLEKERGKDRSRSLIRAIMQLENKAIQKYYLAPNIKQLNDNPFTKGMKFEGMLDFNTVYLEKHDLYQDISGDEVKKGNALLKILKENPTKTLIYAGTYADTDRVANLIIANRPAVKETLLDNFAGWLAKHYDANWKLPHLVRRKTGIHNGRLHRSLSQIQVRLFEEDGGFDNIISTSSIIEGVNTSAENVVIWRNRNGTSKLTDFTYKNIIGRGGRMFRHFIGNIYLLDKPPAEEQTRLDIPYPDDMLTDIEGEKYLEAISQKQINQIITFKEEMRQILGPTFDRMLRENKFHSTNTDLIRKIAIDMKTEPDKWNGLAYLNSEDPENWSRLLFKVVDLQGGAWDIRHGPFVSFVKILADNWKYTIPELLELLSQYDIDIDKFFTLERNVCHKLAPLLGDINELQKVMLGTGTDISPFVAKLSHAFLPSVVYQLEEYGLPRMIAKKLHQERIINFLDASLTIHGTIQKFHKIGKDNLLSKAGFSGFDKYIIDYFYDGITLEQASAVTQPA